MEQDERETAGGVTRSQNVVMTLPHDWSGIGRFLRPALERVDGAARETQLLVLTPDAETAVAVARAALFGDDMAEIGDEAATADEDGDLDELEARGETGENEDEDERGGALRSADDDGPDVLAVTSARRAARQLRERASSDSAPSVVVGTPAEIAALIRASALRLGTVRSLIVAWADAILDSGAAADLEAVMAEVPKEAARLAVTAAPSAEVDALVERYLRRARRIGESVVPEEAPPVTVHYVSVSETSRAVTLRRLLDELDPPSAVVVARTPDSQAEALDALRALGYRDEDEGVIVTDGDVAENTACVIFFDVPRTRAELDAALGASPVQLIVLAQPRQLAHLRALTAGGRLLAHTLPEAAARVRRRDERLRAELRALLGAGLPPRELTVLEPLLGEFDGVEIAAAAVRLLERERERSAQLLSGTHTGVTAKGTGSAAQSAAAVAAGQWKRVFMTVGEMDGVRASDIVGAVTAQGGLGPDKVGKVEIRDNHTLVEVAAEDAERVADKLNGVTVRGRRVVARLDQDRASREGGTSGAARRPSGGGDRPPRSDRGERGGSFERGGAGRGFDRGGSRGDRPSAGRGFDRGAPRGDRPERGGRPSGGGAGGDRFGRGAGRPAGGERGPGARPPRRDERGGERFSRDDRAERGPRAASERTEWQERADRLRQSRPRRPSED